MKIIFLIILFGILGYVAYTLLGGLKPAVWSGTYTSSAFSQTYKQDFSSKDECSAWLMDKKNMPGDYTDYTCGKNCILQPTGHSAYTCEESNN